MAVLVKVTVENPDEILSLYGAGAIVQLQTSATETGVYADVDTVAVVTGVYLYTIDHSAGTLTSWYRTRYENATETLTSDWSPVFQVGMAEAYVSLETFRAYVRNTSCSPLTPMRASRRLPSRPPRERSIGPPAGGFR